MNVHQDSNARNRENGGNTENAVSTVSKAFPDCDSRKATAMMIEQTEHRQRDWRTYEGRVVTKAQEARLIRKAKGSKGVPPDERARRELVKQMLPLVAWQAKKHVGLGGGIQRPPAGGVSGGPASPRCLHPARGVVRLLRAAVDTRLDPWTIKRLESGDWGGSRLRTVRKLAEALEVDPRELLEEE
jgi:hypothetical protein